MVLRVVFSLLVLKNRKQDLSRLNTTERKFFKSIRKLVNIIRLFIEESREFYQKTRTLSGHPGMVDTFSETNAGS